MKSILLFLLLFIVISSNYAAKILVFNPKFGISHVTFTGKIADTLAHAGHEIVVYQPILNENITFTGSKHKSIRYYTKPKNFSISPEFTIEGAQKLLWEEDSFAKMRQQGAVMYKVKYEFCVDILNDKENLQKLKKENFDLGLTEIFEACGFNIFKHIGLKKYIATSGSSYSAMHMDLLGVPVPLSYTPGLLSSFTDNMTYIERFKNFFSVLAEVVVGGRMFVGGAEGAMKDVHDPNYSMKETIQDSVFFFVNSDQVVDYVLPSTPKVVYIGGMGKVQSKPLEKKYTDIFNSAKKGVIFFSFGSVVRSSLMKPEIKQAFLDAFAEFPDINFIWKYEEDDDVGKNLKNLYKEKWLPQPDILEHPKLLAFISHGGMNSVIEGATRGAAMICVPIFADQTHNAQLLYKRKTAITLNKMKLTKDYIVEAIKEMVNNNEYRQNAKLLSKMVKAQALTADEKIVKYTDFAVQFGHTQPFQSSGRFMNKFQLYSLDVIAAYLSIITLVLIILFLVIRKVYRVIKSYFCKSCNQTAQTKKNQ